jgi:hypothetical protein
LLLEAPPEFKTLEPEPTDTTPFRGIMIINTLFLVIHKLPQRESSGRISGRLVDLVQIVRALSRG